MRTYSGLLLFENLFDYVPPELPDLLNLSISILQPDLQIVEENCGTTLGKFGNVNFEIEGDIELATGLPISKSRIEVLLSQGSYEVAIRHVSTCISQSGICSKCFHASFPELDKPLVNSRVTVLPTYLVNSEVLVIQPQVHQYAMVTDEGGYDYTHAYCEGERLIPDHDYFISDNIFNLIKVYEGEKTIVIKCIKYDTFPFVVWLANTFSGSIFGMDPLPHQQLPIRSLLLTSLITENRLQLINEQLNEVPSIPENYLAYAGTIKDTLERGLFMLALYCTYYNVNT